MNSGVASQYSSPVPATIVVEHNRLYQVDICKTIMSFSNKDVITVAITIYGN